MKIKHNAIMVLIGCILLQAGSTGVLANCFAIFNAPIATEFGFTNLEISTVTTIRVCFLAIGIMFGSRFYKKIGFNRFLTICAILTFGLTYLQTLLNTINGFRLIQIPFGFCLGAVVTIPATIMINNWFNEKQGLFLGLSLASSGVAAALASPVCSTLISNHGWRYTLVAFGLVALIIDLPATLLLCKLKPSENEKKYGKVNQNKVTTKKGNNGSTFTLVLAIILVVIIGCVNQLTFQFSLFTKQLGLSLALASSLNSACMIGNTGGKVLLGYIKDKIGPWPTMFLSYCLIGASLILFVTNQNFMIISAGFIGASFAVVTLIPAFVCNELYEKTYSQTSSFISGFGTFAGSIFGSLIGYLSDLLNGYTYIYIGLGILCFMCLINIMILKKEGEKSYE